MMRSVCVCGGTRGLVEYLLVGGRQCRFFWVLMADYVRRSKVYVGNLPLTGVDERDIRDLFEPLGPLRDVWVARKPPGT